MKRFLLYLLIIVALVACTKGDDGESPNPDPTPSKPKTEIKIETTASDFSTEGGRQTISFTTTEAWTAEVINSRADGWCSISPTSGVAGSATITVTTEPNDTPDDRSASIVIKAGSVSKTVKVSQKQRDALTVTASSFEVGAEGGEVKIEVKANINFEYEIDASAKDWVKYEGTRAMKTSTLTFSVAENDDTKKREAKIYITSGDFNEEITIYQNGTEPSIVISQNEYVVSADGETIAVEVASNVDVAVELPANVDWISENTTRAASTNTYRFDIQPNEDYDQRSAEIKFTNKENGLSEVVAIKQMQRDAIVLADSEYEFGIDGGNLDFEVQTNVDITVTISEDAADWIQQVETRTLETKALFFNVSVCSADEGREGTITISGGNATQTITVKQNGLKEILEKEREALIALYNATGGDNWTNNENWCSDKPVNEWYGVTIYGSRVNEIKLNDNNLCGSINGELDVLTALVNFHCSTNKITSIEVKLPKLVELRCDNNPIKRLVILSCPSLGTIDCTNGELGSIDISQNFELTSLVLDNNNISKLDITHNHNLFSLSCNNNGLSELNIKNAPLLKGLFCSNNQLSSLDVSHLTNLLWIDCSVNKIKSFELVSEKLQWIRCTDNQLTELKIPSSLDLNLIYCDYNNIKELVIGDCPMLEGLYCHSNKLENLDVANFKNLRFLICDNNKLSNIDVSNNLKLADLWIYNNNINNIDISYNTQLKSLLCHFNDIDNLDISHNSNLETLWCYSNNLKELDLSKNNQLKQLVCGNELNPDTNDIVGNNSMSNLDVSKNVNLLEFSCWGLNLSSIDISKCSLLYSFECSRNPIKELDLSNNPALVEIYAHHTDITSINVNNAPNLALLECGYNNIKSLDVASNYKLKELWCSATLQSTLDVSCNPYLTWLSTVESQNLEKIYITDYQTFEYKIDDHTEFAYKTGTIPPNDLYQSTDYSKDGEVAILQSATMGSGIDIVLMGDGYSDRLIADGTYDQVMNKTMEKFFEEEPYKSFRDHFNVYSVKAVSKNEGFETGYEDTAFAGYFGAGSIVGGNNQRVFSYTQYAIGEERINDALIVVVMNSDAYAGTCYMHHPTDGDWGNGVSISYFPTGKDDNMLAQVIHHEVCGHGFSKLGDEYAYDYMGEVPFSEVESAQTMATYGWWKNVDFTNDPAKIKWSHFLSDSRYAGDGLGVYEGAYTYWTGAYRPTWNSIMRYNTGGFNAPSREAIYYRIHKLAYGADWEYDYEEFVEWDARNRSTASATRGVPYRMEEPKDFKPLHAPVVMKTSWRNAKNNAPAKKPVTPFGNAGRNLQKASLPSMATASKSMTATKTITLPDGTTCTITTTASGATQTAYRNSTKK